MESRQRTKQWILKAAVFLLLILAALTFFSKSVRMSMLPRVRYIAPWADTLKRSAYIYDFQVTELGTQSVVAGGDWQIEEVFVSEGDTVEEGSVLFTVNTDRQQSELWRLLSAAEEIDNVLANPALAETDRRALELNSAAAWRDYRTLRDSFPSSGEVTAPAAGVVTALTAEAYLQVSRGATLVEFAGSETTEVIEFRLNAGEQSIYGSLNEIEVFLTGSGRYGTVKTSVLSAKKDGEEYIWRVETPKEGYQGVHSVQYLLLEDNSENYQAVLPNSCIQQDPTLGEYVYVVDESEPGINTVETMLVRVLETGLSHSAIDIFRTDIKVVNYASKSIAQGDEVVVIYDE